MFQQIENYFKCMEYVLQTLKDKDYKNLEYLQKKGVNFNEGDGQIFLDAQSKFNAILQIVNDSNLQVFECEFDPDTFVSNVLGNEEIKKLPNHPDEQIQVLSNHADRITSFIDNLDWQTIKLPCKKMLVMTQDIMVGMENEVINDEYDQWIIIGVLVSRSNVFNLIKMGKSKYACDYIIKNGVFNMDLGIQMTFMRCILLNNLIEQIEHINNLQTIVVNRSSINSRLVKINRKQRIKTPLFYNIVKLKDDIVHKDMNIIDKRYYKECDHQINVRGHYIRRIAQGPTPIDPHILKSLMKNPHRIIIQGIPKPGMVDPSVIQDLTRRGIEFTEGKWISYLKVWRSENVRFKDKPLPSFKTIRVVE